MFNKPAINIIKTVILLIICSFLAGCSVFTGPRVWRQTGPEVPELSVFDETMKDFMTSRKVMAGSLAITYESRLIFARGYKWSKVDSPATKPTALFRIASLSKPITSAGILKLVEDKRLSLHDKVMEILSFGTPEGEIPDPNLKKVTILHLLEHLGGWDRDKTFETMFSLPATIARENYKPGEKYYACGWNVRDYGNGRRNTWHTGSLPGCYTFMARWSNGVNCVVLFNKRRPDFKKIDPILSNTVKSISNWPSHDLFVLTDRFNSSKIYN